MLAISFAETVDAIPPFGWPAGPSIATYAALVADDFYLQALLHSLLVSAVTSALCLLLGYPMALAIARAPTRRRPLLLMAVILPFWTGFLLRITAWIALLRDDGWINFVLRSIGLAPLRLLYTDTAMYLGMTYAYLPFMILPLFARLSRQDPALAEAAADLGARPWLVFRRVTWPLSRPGCSRGWCWCSCRRSANT